MHLGVHISGAGDISEAAKLAAALGCDTMQIFSRSPQRWRTDFMAPQDIDKFIQSRDEFKIKPVFIHIPYLINLASPNPKLYHASIEAYIEDILEAQALKADYIVTHMGSHKDTSEQAGLERLTQALNIIIEKTKNTQVGILLENTSGSGSWLGYKFSHHRQVIQGLNDKRRIGLCFDTAHAYSAGYDIATKEGLEDTLDEIKKLVGLSLLQVIHLNDSKDPLGSKRDRHEHIGKGKIGQEAMRRIVRHPVLSNLSFILETPKDTIRSDEMNLKVVRAMQKG
ncbi:MAG: deoxyribonuclease IV [Candidatus Omnitrophota bacterium]